MQKICTKNKRLILNLFFFIALILFTTHSNICWAQSPSPYWTGNGGKGIKVTVSEPTGTGLSSKEQVLLTLIQSTIIGSFQKFSDMTVFDRQNLENILKQQQLSMDGNYSDTDYIRIGNLTNANLVVFGSITKTGNNYMFELAVTDVETGEREASYIPRQVSLLALENLTAIREASADLLGQLGVNLTPSGLQELRSIENTARVQAENALARGIAAQRQGTVVDALSYFIMASNYDQSLTEAASRMNILNKDISSGNIGADTRNEIAWRRQWVSRLQEAETFFANYVKEPQPYILAYSTDVQKGNINWQNETISLSFFIELIPENSWVNPINEVINAVKSGLASTGKAKAWEINWPSRNANGGPTVFTSQTKNFRVVIEIINDKGLTIGRQTVNIPYGYEINGGMITSLKDWNGSVSFPSVKADDITDILNIRIASIDGITTENVVTQKRVSIIPLAEYRKIYGVYGIGDTGPAGGIVFYDKRNNSGGWRYLEAVPAQAEFTASWSPYDLRNVATQTGIGTGRQNTLLLVDLLKSKTGMAAQRCFQLKFGGYSDWFLPSIDELELMYKNLKQRGLGGFSNREYWSSSYDGYDLAHCQRFRDGLHVSGGNTDARSVRAIRAF